MHGEIILRLIERCEAAQRAGASMDEIRRRLLHPEIQALMQGVNAQAFLEKVKDDREYSFYYYDAQQTGACAKPAEVAALILESIALDALDERATANK